MRNDIVNRRRQIFNTIQLNNCPNSGEAPTESEGLYNLIENPASNPNAHTQAETAQSDDVFQTENHASDNVVTLTDESGTQVQFELLDVISYRRKEYVVLLPVEDESEQVVILQIETLGPDEEAYIGVDNEYTLEAVFSLFKERHKHEFNFT